MRAIIKQLWREFWIPLALATFWTLLVFAFGNTEQKKDFLDLAAMFFAAFFLASWATGQFVRVSRQQQLQNSLGSLAERMSNLVHRIDNEVTRILSAVTGGESFCHISFPPTADSVVANAITACQLRRLHAENCRRRTGARGEGYRDWMI